jgi:hypothetical protein
VAPGGPRCHPGQHVTLCRQLYSTMLWVVVAISVTSIWEARTLRGKTGMR